MHDKCFENFPSKPSDKIPPTHPKPLNHAYFYPFSSPFKKALLSRLPLFVPKLTVYLLVVHL